MGDARGAGSCTFSAAVASSGFATTAFSPGASADSNETGPVGMKVDDAGDAVGEAEAAEAAEAGATGAATGAAGTVVRAGANAIQPISTATNAPSSRTAANHHRTALRPSPYCKAAPSAMLPTPVLRWRWRRVRSDAATAAGPVAEKAGSFPAHPMQNLALSRLAVWQFSQMTVIRECSFRVAAADGNRRHCLLSPPDRRGPVCPSCRGRSGKSTSPKPRRCGAGSGR